ncbi:shikimate dehydrogenase [Enterobacteriaceae endosymbiont of Donacia versicolorea]|uniref:shikimate dehydrogenase n=1 Tax=Enterobacteriaceae endosymbiont of Donacia versicolorea TaxID=2675788 RepID=UPI001449F210|nr:shikimate dehydrogenase [Enterobacteriaceae endosymbiont of Donacia versicolorea]QJC32105.1 shikimate dehydrogenase [Enterobacteriaceae endosymbiont of Donacia versicolorea]
MKRFAVFGNPIKHSKSPIIHKLFAKQTGILQKYTKICVPIDNFHEKLLNFFKNGGNGANITIPFKKKAYKLCNTFTERAKYSGVVNTIKIMKSQEILGDNTDGIGLLQDLKNLKFIHPKSKILLIGAGGAAQGIIYSLIKFGCNITIINRTYQNAKNIIKYFHNIKNLNCIELQHFSKNLHNQLQYNLIINATSSSLKGNIPNISPLIIKSNIFYYDLFYDISLTPFLKWCRFHGAKKISDGIGMLIEQAAYSFYLWHGIMPNTKIIIQKFKKIY